MRGETKGENAGGLRLGGKEERDVEYRNRQFVMDKSFVMISSSEYLERYIEYRREKISVRV